MFLNDKNSALGNYAYSRKGSAVVWKPVYMFVCLSVWCVSVCLFVQADGGQLAVGGVVQVNTLSR